MSLRRFLLGGAKKCTPTLSVGGNEGVEEGSEMSRVLNSSMGLEELFNNLLKNC